MELCLDEQEVRLLGSLLEKELATPEYYPLTLNSLTNACNQKSNREPVVDYDEATVAAAGERLAGKGVVNKSLVGRVPKYEELLIRKRNMVPGEAAVLCILLLRGPQTAGEIRGRTSRLFAFQSLEALASVLERLEEWGLIRRLARLPGHKEPRYAHLLAGEPSEGPAEPMAAVSRSQPSSGRPGSAGDVIAERLRALEEQVAALRIELADLKASVAALKGPAVCPVPSD